VSKDRFEGHPNQALLVNPLRNPIEQILAVSAFTAGGVAARRRRFSSVSTFVEFAAIGVGCRRPARQRSFHG
jgi:hypothetical protein